MGMSVVYGLCQPHTFSIFKIIILHACTTLSSIPFYELHSLSETWTTKEYAYNIYNFALSLVSTIEELLDRKVATPV
jgi:hypothetical protein